MKKTLAVILSIVMLVCCIPFSVNAAENVVWDVNHTISASNELVSGNNYTQQSGILTVPSNMTVYIPAGTTVTVMQGATLRCLGYIIVYGTLIVDGFVDDEGASHISLAPESETASAKAAVRFPKLADKGLAGKIKVSYGVTSSGNSYENIAEDFEWNEVSADGSTVYCSLNQFVHVKAEIIEDEPPFDKYDDSLMTVYINGLAAPYGQGSVVFEVSTSTNVSYRSWVRDDDFLNTFKIHLPTGEGYAVYGREGEQSAPGETVMLKYGQPFAFKVEIDPEYDMSVYEVYIYDGYGWLSLDPTNQDLSGITPAKPDDYGYYVIDSVKGELQIKVEGVVKNETILMVGSILDLVKNIFDMISSFFQEIFAFLGISFGGEAA